MRTGDVDREKEVWRGQSDKVSKAGRPVSQSWKSMACEGGDGCKRSGKCRSYYDDLCSGDYVIGNKDATPDTSLPAKQVFFLPVKMQMERYNSFVENLNSFHVKYVKYYPLTSLISLRTLGIITS